MIARLITALSELAEALLAAFPPPVVVAEGSGTIALVLPGLVPCADCGTEQRPGSVHFATLVEVRPCRGSWRPR